jgi:LmbE family N-acetylglucosaminyl deacetylase
MLLVAAGLVVRCLALLRHRVNSDEPQHLHVAWAWTQGLLPYRDVFDNHSPLFSLAMSLPLRALHERPDVVVLMRVWMLPFALGTMLLAGLVARRVFGERTALWTLAVLGAMPDFVMGSVEYRTDVAWACAWLGVIAVLVCGRLSKRRVFAAGLIAGLALAISMKTTLLIAAACTGAGVAWWVGPRGERPSAAETAGLLAAAGAGFVLVPMATIGAFAGLGALKPMVECTVGYNVLPGLGLWHTAPLRPLGLIAGAPLLVALAVWAARRLPSSAASRVAFLVVSTGLAHLAIETVWPLVVRGDLVPILPVEAVLLAASLIAAPAVFRSLRTRARTLATQGALIVVVAYGLVLTCIVGELGRDRTVPQRRLLAELLRLTRPDDVVMDPKGGAVFRRRPIYTAIETIAEERYRQGLLVDDIPERLVATGTPVVMQDDPAPYPARGWAFMQEHYLPLGGLRVLGQYLDPSGSTPDERTFEVDVPQAYAIYGEGGAARGALDGRPWAGPRRLAAGRHRYLAAPGEGRLALVWAPAVERGYANSLLPGPPLTLTSEDRLLVLAPHPDDETVLNGGLIMAARTAGAEVRVVWATDGEQNPWAQLAHEGRWPTGTSDHARWGRMRREESRAALRALGAGDVGQTWLELPDGGLTRQWMSGDERLADSLLSVLRSFRPTIVSAPSLFDSHPDHSLMALATDLALARAAGTIPEPKLLVYHVHVAGLTPEPSVVLRVPPAARERKRRAIECLSSQLHWRRAELLASADSIERFEPPDTAIAVRQPHRVRGAWIDDDRLVVDFVPGRWPGLGPLALLVSCDGANGPEMRLTLPLPERPGTSPVRDDLKARIQGRASLSRVGDHWRAIVPLALASPPWHAFVKVERPDELNLGFFDESGWWPVAPGYSSPTDFAPRVSPADSSRAQ